MLPPVRASTLVSVFRACVALQDELPIHRVTDTKSILTNLAKSVAGIETLRAVILRPHTDVQRPAALGFQPFEAKRHQARAEAQVLVAREHVELMYFSGRRRKILDRQLARTNRDEPGRL